MDEMDKTDEDERIESSLSEGVAEVKVKEPFDHHRGFEFPS